MDEDYGNSDRMLWFVAGAAVGAAIALLYAPATGVDTRKRLAARTGDGRLAIAGGSREMFERARNLFDQGRRLADEAAEMFERGRQIVEGSAAKLDQD